ncbi:MAG TPA: sigma 54-interacting transcriptional regulator [archaeon]|nr:sigma 54-interacting transcriptional regulator [archaeon]
MNHNNGYVLRGESQNVKEVLSKIEKVAPYDTSVLIVGETGTGKEIVANQIHLKSKRRDRKMVEINCSAVPRDLFEGEFFGHIKGAFTGSVGNKPGLFELSNGGTLFLDEIGAMPIESQPKILRVLESGKFRRLGGQEDIQIDARVISATNSPQIYNNEFFRNDLFYRLSTYVITLAPLRERPDDIFPISDYFLESWSTRNKKTVSLEPEAAEALTHYDYRGNVRELHLILERACIDSKDGKITRSSVERILQEQKEHNGHPYDTSDRTHETRVYADGFTTDVIFPWDIGHVKHTIMREQIKAALATTDGNVAEAAIKLGITRGNLYSRAKRSGLNVENYRHELLGTHGNKQPYK